MSHDNITFSDVLQFDWPCQDFGNIHGNLPKVTRRSLSSPNVWPVRLREREREGEGGRGKEREGEGSLSKLMHAYNTPHMHTHRERSVTFPPSNSHFRLQSLLVVSTFAEAPRFSTATFLGGGTPTLVAFIRRYVSVEKPG